MRFLFALVLLFAPIFAVETSITATQMTIKLETVKGSGEDAMFVVWLETTDGNFVKTLQIFGKKKRYHNTLTTWVKARAPKVKDDALDAVVGATISWQSSGSFTVPLEQGNIKLLSGQYQLHVEQRKDGSSHFTSFVVPLKKDSIGGTFPGVGFLSRLIITLGPDQKKT
jgi:hypothetical protein